ncbi:MAG: metal ABC transporter ATP-binding protein [Spirochaetota bacterium]
MKLELSSAAIGYDRQILISCVDLTIRSGDVIFLSGANGSGKSTLAKSLIGVLPLISGRRDSTFERLAYVPQSSHFETQYPLTVAELVEQGLPESPALVGWTPSVRRQRRDQAYTLLGELGLLSCATSLLREVSGGQLQRALIARSLIGRPDFLLLDEPFSNLDRSGRGETARILQDYTERGATVCVIDHGDAIESSFYSRVWEIDMGHLIERAGIT